MKRTDEKQHWPGPAAEHLDGFGLSGFGPQDPGVTRVLRPVIRVAGVLVQDVVAGGPLQNRDLLQLEAGGLVGQVEGPQHRLLQVRTGTAGEEN